MYRKSFEDNGIRFYSGFLKQFWSRKSAYDYMKKSHLSKTFYYRIIKEGDEYVVYMSKTKRK